MLKKQAEPLALDHFTPQFEFKTPSTRASCCMKRL
jgi:hypothetical protein